MQLHDYSKTQLYFFASRMGMLSTLKVPAKHKIKAASHFQTVGTSSAEDSDGKQSGYETLLAPARDPVPKVQAMASQLPPGHQ